MVFIGFLMGSRRPGTCLFFCSNKRRMPWGCGGRLGGGGFWLLATLGDTFLRPDSQGKRLRVSSELWGPAAVATFLFHQGPFPSSQSWGSGPRAHPGLWRLRPERVQVSQWRTTERRTECPEKWLSTWRTLPSSARVEVWGTWYKLIVCALCCALGSLEGETCIVAKSSK